MKGLYVKKKYKAKGKWKVFSVFSFLVLLFALIMPGEVFALKIIDGVPFVSEIPGFQTICHGGGWYCSEAAFLSVKRYWTMEGELNAACGQDVECLLNNDGSTSAYSKDTCDELYNVWIDAGSPDYSSDGFPQGTLDISEGDLQTVGDNTEHLTYNLSAEFNENNAVAYLEGNLDNDIPVIILVNVGIAPSGTGHYVVVVGYDTILNADGSVNKQSSMFYIRDNYEAQAQNSNYESIHTYDEVFASMRGASSANILNAIAYSPDGLTKREEAVMMVECPSGYKSYPDVGSADWFFWPVLKMTCKGVIQGYPDGRYRPANNVIKAEALKMAIEATGGNVNSNDCSSDAPPYNDVQPGEWYCPYVKYAYERGWLNEFDDTQSFSPGANANRGWVAHMIFEAKGGISACVGQIGSELVLNYVLGNGPPPDSHPFVDVNENLNTEYYLSTYCAEKMGVFEGYLNKDCDGNAVSDAVSFCPTHFINRAEVVAAMMRASELESVYR